MLVSPTDLDWMASVASVTEWQLNWRLRMMETRSPPTLSSIGSSLPGPRS